MNKENPHSNSLLGKHTDYPQHYAPQILTPIARLEGRIELAQSLKLANVEELPEFFGEDIWQAYEVSWLNPKGKPCVAYAQIRVPSNSTFIIESKSFKLYLNSLNQHVFASQQALIELLERDLSAVAQAEVKVTVFGIAFTINSNLDSSTNLSTQDLSNAVLLDSLDIEVSEYQVNAQLLKLQHDPCFTNNSSAKKSAAKPSIKDKQVTETLYSHLLRSSCPVTAQPDWGSVVISYTGAAIDHAAMLQYIISFRNNQEFHEQCIERMFCDISLICKPQHLSVAGFYLRRGGLDINPLRSSDSKQNNKILKTSRQ